MLQIKFFIPESYNHWDGKVVSVIYLGGCNWRCPWCNVPDLVDPNSFEEPKSIPFSEVRYKLLTHKDEIEGVCITGGEPTIHDDLPDLLSKLKKLGFRIKLETNGSAFDLLKRIITEKLVDYVALDVKSFFDLDAYAKTSGMERSKFKTPLSNVLKSIQFLKNLDSSQAVAGFDWEFRTTLIRGFHDKAALEMLTYALNRDKKVKKYVLQNFDNSFMLDQKLEVLKPFTEQEMENFLRVAKQNIPNTIIRKRKKK